MYALDDLTPPTMISNVAIDLSYNHIYNTDFDMPWITEKVGNRKPPTKRAKAATRKRNKISRQSRKINRK